MAYNPAAELLNEDIINRAKKLSPALLSDGMKNMGIPCNGCMEAAILPVTPEMKVVGTAYTVSTSDGDNFPIHAATYQGAPGYVMVIDGKGYDGCAYLGDLIMGAAKAIGYEGIICDGCVRDRNGASQLGLPVFSKGYMQNGPSKKGPGEINVPVTCGGIEVCPGDLVVGDADGVTVVPRDRIEEVLDKAEEKLAYEIERSKTIAEYARARQEGTKLPQLAPEWVLDMLGSEG